MSQFSSQSSSQLPSQNSPHSAHYEHVYIDNWQAFSCAGDALQSYAACNQQRSQLTLSHEGSSYLGICPQFSTNSQYPLQDFLIRCARACLSAEQIATITEFPILCVSSSKGSIQGLVSAPQQFLQSLPGMLAPHLARNLNIDHYIGYAPVAACSTGLNALLSAADLLDRHASEQAFCAAADASLDPFLLGGYKNLGVLAKETPQAFSDTHTGFAPAEGVAFISMTRAPHIDSHSAQSTLSSSSQPSSQLLPQLSSQWRVCGGIRLADASHITRCENTDVIHQCLQSLWELLPQPELIVTHATGTENSDTFEGDALANGPWNTATLLNCKPYIGHCLGASGLVELAIGLHAPVQRLWKISLGFGGHIAAVALERVSAR